MTEEQVFLAALDLDNPDDRTAFLEKACGGDVAFRRQVDELLAAHFKPGEFLNEPLGRQLGSGLATPVHDCLVSQIANQRGGAGAGEKKPEEEHDDLQFLKPSARPDSLGRIGHYEVLQVLGRGGFGIVFRAFDEALQRVVALKALAPTVAATSPARKRFLREARSSARVRHENVVQIHAVEEQPLPYLVMEFIPGETLQQRINRTGPLDAPEIVRFGRQIAEALAAAHATGLIHRDIKPCNVLIEEGHQRIKVNDFGLARAADDASLTQSGMLAGTPMFMAPEQARGEPLDHRADLFSLGSVLYVMATGRPPFRASTTYAVLRRVIEDSPRPIRDLIPETPQWLSDIIAKLQAKKSSDRFQSAREVADVLADCETRLGMNPPPKSFSRISRSRPSASRFGQWKWLVAAVLFLPVLALAATEFIGLTHWLHHQQPIPDQSKNVEGEQTRLERPQDNGLPVDFNNTLAMKFKLIPAGKFKMGSSPEEIEYWLNLVEQEGHKLFLRSESPEHEVEITKPFYLGATEVTVGQFRQFIEANPKYMPDDDRWNDPGFKQTNEHPVVWISWRDASEFCNWLSKKEGRKYRLPTEAEWEYACRAGTNTRYCYGDDEAQLDRHAWFINNSKFGTKPVAGKKSNNWGLFDMHGNAWEWCQDYHDFDYYQNSPARDPMGPEDGMRYVKRGGAWCFGAVDARSAYRSHTGGGCECGFRVLLVAPPDNAPAENAK
ncbi:bifunctional serine/threonine-protein kinase/formylglycine-generating enzyme family protein [Zavarzinella formosa]|uniref:bifunctional serine/threonine-protein kinase/formylglycine-generating enzyme family protein n=1 Tax=Zavarzinella formosa TaxID=360055 RepID=UPI0002E5C349|nr:bifunctional serine/threonine-protein kinase/formylglycine-generating enzyme family protein [Zavarzinella formosa]